MFVTCIALRNIIYICSVPITVTDKFRTTSIVWTVATPEGLMFPLTSKSLLKPCSSAFFVEGLHLLVFPLPLLFSEAEISTVAITLADEFFAELSDLLPLPLLILGDFGKSKSKLTVLSGSIAHWNTASSMSSSDPTLSSDTNPLGNAFSFSLLSSLPNSSNAVCGGVR